MRFAKRVLRQRIIALVAAYAIAFSGAIASFVAGQAAAELGAQADVVICHNNVADQQAPASDQTDGKMCADCCVGCIASLAMAVPPTVPTVGHPQLSFKRLDLPARVIELAGAKANAHRSRGPPLV